MVGMDFFTTEVLTLKGLTTYYVLFFIHLETRRVNLLGFTPHPDQEWMEQQARNMTMEEWGCLRGCRYLLHDRDAKFCQSFRELIKTGSVNEPSAACADRAPSGQPLPASCRSRDLINNWITGDLLQEPEFLERLQMSDNTRRRVGKTGPLCLLDCAVAAQIHQSSQEKISLFVQ
ncbi:MAG: hypothetical protein DMG39_06270 [Acidobacteria bacterium]|nr:MAG: hypothetical protein DMG39_06270 [Acidobacteriota bacterium]